MTNALNDVLEPYNITATELAEQVSDPFGSPLWIALIGSVSLGWGNPESDLDICVVVDNEEVTPLPITSYVRGTRIDVRYFSASVLDVWLDRLSALQSLSYDLTTGDAHNGFRFSIFHASRIADGLPLVDELVCPESISTVKQLCPGAVGLFWEVLAARHTMMHSLLVEAGAPPQSIRYRSFTAAAAMVESFVARRGLYYYGPKWLGQKLAQLKRLDLWERVALNMNPRHDVNEAGLRSLATELGLGLDQWRSTFCLSIAADTEIFDVLGRPMISRWRTQGYWLDVNNPTTSALVEAGSQGPDTPLDLELESVLANEQIVDLLRADLLWLGSRGGK